MAPRPDLVIVGGGLIGLAAARALARRGAAVTVLDRDPEPRGASWAAGGMLAPLVEAPDPGPFLTFGLEALVRWPGWAAEIEREGGLPVGLTRRGELMVAGGGDATDALRARFDWQAAAGHRVEWLDGTAPRAVEPALADGWTAGLHLPGHAHVDPRRLLKAVAAAARAAGVDVRSGVGVRGVARTGHTLRGVQLDDGTVIPAPRVVVAAGAWSGGLAGLPRPLPVAPVRGQMLEVALERPLLGGLLVGGGVYLIPRDHDHRPSIVVGSTMERVGFDTSTDPATIALLRRRAEALLPALRGLPERARWAGLRPGTPDDLPVIGADPELPGLIVATGHHRNGVLLAPVTADAVADLVAGRPLAEAWAAAFDPARFDAGPPAVSA